MSTVSQIVARALRLLNVLDAQEAPEASAAVNAIAALNAMCQRWEANGLALGWTRVTVGTDTMPSPDEAEEAIVYQLALRLNGEYGAPLSNDDKALAKQFLAELRRDRLVEMPLTLDSDAPMPWHGGRWNIYTDSPV